MRWNIIGAYALALFACGTGASTAVTYALLHFGCDLSSPISLASGYMVNAIVLFLIAYFFALRAGPRPYLVGLIAYLFSHLAATLGLYLAAGVTLVSWLWLADSAWGMAFIALGTAVRAAISRARSSRVGA